MFRPINIIFAIVAGTLMGVTCAAMVVWLADAAFGRVVDGETEQWLMIGLSAAWAVFILPKSGAAK